MSQRMRVIVAFTMALALVGTLAAAHAQGRIRIGDELPYKVATPAAYPLGGPDRPVAWSETVFSPGAKFLRIHFSKFNLPDSIAAGIPAIGGHDTAVLMHNDGVAQGLSEVPFMQDVERWGVLTIGTGLGNARFTNRSKAKDKAAKKDKDDKKEKKGKE